MFVILVGLCLYWLQQAGVLQAAVSAAVVTPPPPARPRWFSVWHSTIRQWQKHTSSSPSLTFLYSFYYCQVSSTHIFRSVSHFRSIRPPMQRYSIKVLILHFFKWRNTLQPAIQLEGFFTVFSCFATLDFIDIYLTHFFFFSATSCYLEMKIVAHITSLTYFGTEVRKVNLFIIKII